MIRHSWKLAINWPEQTKRHCLPDSATKRPRLNMNKLRLIILINDHYSIDSLSPKTIKGECHFNSSSPRSSVRRHLATGSQRTQCVPHMNGTLSSHKWTPPPSTYLTHTLPPPTPPIRWIIKHLLCYCHPSPTPPTCSMSPLRGAYGIKRFL